MPEPCECPSLDSCKNRYLWAHKEVGLVLHQVVGFVLLVEDAEKFLQSLDPFLTDSKQGPALTATEEDGGDRRLQDTCKA